MTEREWVDSIAERLMDRSSEIAESLVIKTGYKLPYGHEIRRIGEGEAQGETSGMSFETDLSILEQNTDGTLIPRVIVEAKLKSINTHDVITYSHKAAAHKAVFPFLRYGVMMGNRRTYPLPGRLYRHGANFDFMVSFVKHEPSGEEFRRFVQLLVEEVEASKVTEKIIYDSRKKGRDHFTVLHRKLVMS